MADEHFPDLMRAVGETDPEKIAAFLSVAEKLAKAARASLDEMFGRKGTR